MSDNYSLQNLPLELKQRTASFLSPRDAIQLSRCCKALHSSLCLSSLHPPRLVFGERRFLGDRVTGDKRERGCRLPVGSLQRRVHSLTLVFRWRDQGWGNRKGQVWIVGRARHAPIDPDHPWHGGTPVLESPTLAPHQEEECRMTFVPKEDQIYHLFYKVGSGGGHQLFLRRGVLHSVIFDDPPRNFATNYRLLRQHGALPEEPAAVHHGVARDERTGAGQPGPADAALSNFAPDLLIRVCQSLRAQLSAGQPSDPGLSSFFEDYSIPVNEDSLIAVQEIVQADLEERRLTRQEMEAEAAAPAADNDRPDGAGQPPHGWMAFQVGNLQELGDLPGPFPPWMGNIRGADGPPAWGMMGMGMPMGPPPGQMPGMGPLPGRGFMGPPPPGPRGGPPGVPPRRDAPGRAPRPPNNNQGARNNVGPPPFPPGPPPGGPMFGMMGGDFPNDQEGVDAMNAVLGQVLGPDAAAAMEQINAIFGDMPRAAEEDDMSDADDENMEVVD